MSEERKVSVEEALGVLNEKGYVLWKAPTAGRHYLKVDANRFRGKTTRVAIVSDTHLGSRYQQLSYLRAFYRYCSRKGISVVLHAGDLVDGERIYRGQEYEVFAAGVDAQAEYAVNNYPRYKGIKTYLISGNHDSSFQAQAGIDIVNMICRQRDDMVYLGYGGATVEINGVKFDLIHPDGGVPYARSYRSQKIVEQLPGGTKPNVLILGHLHVTNILPSYRNVLVIMAGCFQAQTPYLRRKGLAPDVGAYVVEYETSDVDVPSGTVGFRVEWRPFPISIENDF